MTLLGAEAATDETFWAAAGAVAALLAIPTTIAMGWLAYRAAWPRRVLRWSARPSSLTWDAAPGPGGLAVTYAGTQLTQPHIVEVELSNVGNKDVDPAHFNGRPIEITSNRPVIAVLQQTSEPAVQRVLTATQHPDRVELDTGTPLHKGQTVRYVVLTDGLPHNPGASLPDIDLRISVSNCKVERRAAASLQPTRDRIGTLASVVTAVGALALLVATLYYGANGKS